MPIMDKNGEPRLLCANWSAMDEATQNLLRPLVDTGALVTSTSADGKSVQLTFAGRAVAANSEVLQRYLHARSEFLTWRQRLHARASLWHFGGRPSELLLNEEESRTALRWKAESPDEFSTVELAYIDESAKSQHGLGRATVPWNLVATVSVPTPSVPTQSVPMPSIPPAPQPSPAPAPPPSPVLETVAFAPPPAPPAPPVASTRSRALWVGGGLAVASLLVVLAVLFSTKGRVAGPPASASLTPAAEARQQLQAGLYADAVTSYDRAITAGEPLYTERAYARRLKGDLEGALADYQQAIRSGQADEQTYSDIAYVYTLRRDYDSAVKFLTEGIHLNPSTTKLYVDRGSAYLARKDYKSALADYESALRTDSTSAAAQAGRLAALTALNRPVGKSDAPPRVYIHIASEVQRYAAKAILDYLRDAGYDARGIQYVGSWANIPKQNQVRYVFTEDRSQAERLAQDIQMRTSVGLKVTIEQVKAYQNNSPRHLELWFAAPGNDGLPAPKAQSNSPSGAYPNVRQQ